MRPHGSKLDFFWSQKFSWKVPGFWEGTAQFDILNIDSNSSPKVVVKRISCSMCVYLSCCQVAMRKFYRDSYLNQHIGLNFLEDFQIDSFPADKWLPLAFGPTNLSFYRFKTIYRWFKIKFVGPNAEWTIVTCFWNLGLDFQLWNRCMGCWLILSEL